MGFKFTYLCDLLSNLDDNRFVKASTASKISNPDTRVVTRWFAQHEKRLHQAADPLAVLSCLFPEKRPDRVYWLQDASLARVIGRCLLLGSSRREELDSWRASGGTDLGQCVEDVMRQAENHILDGGQEVLVEEIDAALNGIASRCRFSGPRVRRQHAAVDVEEALGPLYRRLSSRDAKWLTRMILKSYDPVVLPENLVFGSFHFLLPHLLLFQDSFDTALSTLSSEPIRHFPPHPESNLARGLCAIAVQHLSPVTGVKIGRPEYYKARGIKHCCQMVGQRRMSLERKYDGEYCQIHVDLTKRGNAVQIFSKSGKDSTVDRSGVHEVIRQTLRIGEPDCRFSHRCILEGELLVWSDKHGKIMDFHKLRKFISRSGTLIGAENDSPPQPYEHLMIVFFDILLIDDDVCLRKPHRERRLLLKDAIRAIPGRADIAEQEIFDFSRPDSSHRLARSFAKRIAQRWEGYVLKGSDEPYFSIFSTGENGSVGRWIKLKKDYVPGLGDTVDLAIIGGRYDSRDAAAIGCKLSWTHFMIGCLINKEAMMHHKAKPKFRVVDMISRYSMSRQNLHVLNQFGQFSACPIDSDHGFEIENGPTNLPYMSMVFKSPFVVEMMGGGFEKPSGARYFTLRFPRVVKIHWDRTFEDAASFSELQLLAEAARSVPQEDMSQEENRWAKRLRLGNGSAQYIVDRSQSPVSTGSSSSCSETSSIPCTGDRAQPSNQAKSSTDAVPIYIDPEISRPSSAESDNRGFLTENENLSQHNRELHTKHSNDPTENASHTEKTKPHTLSPRTAKPTLKSPLPFIPIYLPDTPSQPLLTKSPQTITNLATFLKAFSQQTQSQPHKPNSTYALTCLNATQTELGPELLSLAKAVETRRNTPSFPCIGKIFILDSAFLYLNADPADTRFCLRETWAGIARRYFYACLGWSVGGIEIRFDGDELAELVSWDGV